MMMIKMNSFGPARPSLTAGRVRRSVGQSRAFPYKSGRIGFRAWGWLADL
jgi:hypothetical protein